MNPRLMFIVAYMFPVTVNWLASADECVPLTLYVLYSCTDTLDRMIHVGISCEI